MRFRRTGAHRAARESITRLILAYATAIDAGDFRAVGGLFAEAQLRGSAGTEDGRYHDRFVRAEREWRFAERLVDRQLSGDLSHHLR